MKYRPLGATGVTVSEIGFGSWGIGGKTEGLTSYGDTDDATSTRALFEAIDHGITFFDTSNVYGYGRSETLIGDALGAHRRQVVIATKAGFARYGEPPDFSPGAIRRSLEASLGRLRTDFVDLLQLHNPPIDMLRERREIVDALERLRREGKIRCFGISVKTPQDGVDAIEDLRFPVVQANLNMMDLRALECGLIDAASRHNAGLIGRTPLCFGFLSGAIAPDAVFPLGDHRNGWPREQLRRWIDGAESLFALVPRMQGATRTQIALRFCLSFAEVSTVIPGMLTPSEVVENAAASDIGPLSPEIFETIIAANRATSFFASP